MSDPAASFSPAVVACLGPEGSFSYLLTQMRFPGVPVRPLANVGEVFDLMAADPMAMGIVPIENSSGGFIIDTVDRLVDEQTSVRIVEELTLNVKLALLGKLGAPIEVIYSHAMPFFHSDAWLRENYPNALHLAVSGWDLDGKLLEDVYDRQRVLTTFNHHIASYYSQHRTIVLDGNNLCAETRQTLASLVRNLQAKVTMVFFDTSWETLLKKNASTENPLSLEKLQESYNYLRYPHPWEAHEIIVV